MERSEVYRDAVKVLRDQGWKRGSPRHDELEVCILGAVRQAETGAPWRWDQLSDELLTPLRSVIGEQYPEHAARPFRRDTVFIYAWNDDEAESVDEVIAVLEKAAVFCDDDGS